MITCKFEDGPVASLRHVTVDAIIVEDDRILLVKRGARLHSANLFALPGGFLDRDEATPEAIKREVREETGYEAREVTLFRVNDNPQRKGEDRQNVDFVFLVEVGEKISSPDMEVKESDWFELDNLPRPEEFAFDHYENIELYLKYREENFDLPLIG